MSTLNSFVTFQLIFFIDFLGKSRMMVEMLKKKVYGVYINLKSRSHLNYPTTNTSFRTAILENNSISIDEHKLYIITFFKSILNHLIRHYEQLQSSNTFLGSSRSQTRSNMSPVCTATFYLYTQSDDFNNGVMSEYMLAKASLSKRRIIHKDSELTTNINELIAKLFKALNVTDSNARNFFFFLDEVSGLEEVYNVMISAIGNTLGAKWLYVCCDTTSKLHRLLSPTFSHPSSRVSTKFMQLFPPYYFTSFIDVFKQE